MLLIEHDHLRERVSPDVADDPLRLPLYDPEVFHP
jgi:hypothetical protein